MLMIVIVFQVLLRYGFQHVPMLSFLIKHQIKLEELQWHLYAMGMMVGLGYALLSDAHIRVDILYHRYSPKTKAVVDICGTVFLLLPFLGFLFWYSLPFVQKAFEIHERSDAPSGLPARWIIMSFIPIGCLILFAAAVSHLLRNISKLRKN